MFHSSTSFSMDLGCPLLRGSFVRRLRRRAATHRHAKSFEILLCFEELAIGEEDILAFFSILTEIR